MTFVAVFYSSSNNGGGGGSSAGEFHVSPSSRIVDPDGGFFWGSGMNVAVTINLNNGIQAPFVFEGLDADFLQYDVYPGDTGGGYYGGGWNNDIIRSAAAGWTDVEVPDRMYAFNGHYSAKAQALGITPPVDHWHNKVMRPNCIPRGGGDNPSPAVSIPQFVEAIQQFVDGGVIVMPECHNMTGSNTACPPNLVADPTIASSQIGTQTIRDAIDFQDAIVAAFGTNGSGGTTNTEKGYVWITLPNEPWSSVPDTNYEDWVITFVARARAQGAHNIISVPLAFWGQDLGGIRAGRYDNLRSRLITAGLDWNLVWEWHCYGADTFQTPVGWHGYESAAGYANMDVALDVALNGGSPAGHTFPVVVGEYGEPSPLTLGTAGPAAWNVAGVDCLARTTYGQRLAEKYPIPLIAWHGSGDGTTSKKYKLTTGPSEKGWPAWDIDGTNLGKLSPFGVAHWDVSHAIWSKTT